MSIKLSWLQIAICKAFVAGSSLALLKQDLVIGEGQVSSDLDFVFLSKIKYVCYTCI